MNQTFGGKKGFVPSSSDLLRAVRIGVQTGANASYKNDPKKTRAAGDTSSEVLEQSTISGVFTELSTLVGTVNPYAPPPPPVPLEFVTQYIIGVISEITTGNSSIVFSGDGYLYVVGTTNAVAGTSTLYRVATNGTYRQIVTIDMITSSALIGNDGYMYISGDKGVVRCSPTDGLFTYIAVVGLGTPSAIAQSPNNVLFVSSATNKYTISNGQVTPYNIGFAFYGMLYASDDYLYVSAVGGIYRINFQNKTYTLHTATNLLFYTLIQANDGILYGITADSGVYRISPETGVMSQFSPALSGTSSASGLTQAADESLYVTTMDLFGQAVVYHIQVNGVAPIPPFIFTTRLTGLPASAYWTSIASNSDGTKLAMCGQEGYVYTSSNSGVSWTLSTTNLPAATGWESIASNEDGTKLVICATGKIYTSTNSGNSWSPSLLTPNLFWGSIASSSNGMKLAVVDVYINSRLYTSSDGGLNWVSRNTGAPPTGTNNYFNDITSSSDGVKLAVTHSNGFIYTSSDGGVNWTKQLNSNIGGPIFIASSSDCLNLVTTSGLNGYIYTSSNGGVDWVKKTSGLPVGTQWTSITSSWNGTTLAACTYDGLVYTSSDSGDSWVKQTNGLTSGANWKSIASNFSGTKLAVVGYTGKVCIGYRGG